MMDYIIREYNERRSHSSPFSNSIFMLISTTLADIGFFVLQSDGKAPFLRVVSHRSDRNKYRLCVSLAFTKPLRIKTGQLLYCNLKLVTCSDDPPDCHPTEQLPEVLCSILAPFSTLF